MDEPDPVNAQLRQLPSVDRLVRRLSGRRPEAARWALLGAARDVLEDARRALVEGSGGAELDAGALVRRAQARADDLERAWPARVLNATGVVLHTNLGRAPLARGALAAVAEAAGGYSDLELDLARGERGSRLARIADRLRRISGAEDALVVNNNAAAVLLAVDTLAAGREVLLSRGELVEIGGSFRMPEILGSSRARLVEVGTTNRTHLRDYEAALGPETGCILKVHRSCFEIRGYTAEVELPELKELARRHGLPLVEDRGSGSLIDLRAHGIPEPPAWWGIEAGADVVLFSGDKLLGGPQAGIVLGSGELVARMRRHPLARAVRVDKLTLAALYWTLGRILDGSAPRELPVLRMLLTPPEVLRARAEKLADGLRLLGLAGVEVEAHAGVSGGGSLPDLELPGWAVRATPRGSADALASRLRAARPPLLARVQRDALLLDPRTLDEADLSACVEAFRQALV